MAFPEGLGLAVICPREDPRDAFVSNRFTSLDALPEGAVVGTSSLRRQCQLRRHRPDLRVKDLRGNVNTRLAKLDQGEYDALILASAGLLRLGLGERIREAIAEDLLLPAVGQGAVGIESRLDDARTRALLAPLADADTTLRVSAERAMNTRLNGGCQVPIAGFATLADGQLTLRGRVGSPCGTEMLADEVQGAAGDAEHLGGMLAERLLAAGAGRILAAVYEAGQPA